MFRPLLCLSLLAALPAAAAIDFAHQVVPILRKHCAECHLGEKKKGGLSMNTRQDLLEGSENGAVVDLAKADQSLLLKVLTTTDEETQMPPKGARVSAAEIETLRRWVAEGLAWEEGFTFGKSGYEPPLKPRVVTLPAAVEGRTHPIDRIIDTYLTTHKHPRPEPADDATFLRRVHLDLIGLPPAAEVVQSFLADRRADKRAKMVAAGSPQLSGAKPGRCTSTSESADNPKLNKATMSLAHKPKSTWVRPPAQIDGIQTVF